MTLRHARSTLPLLLALGLLASACGEEKPQAPVAAPAPPAAPAAPAARPAPTVPAVPAAEAAPADLVPPPPAALDGAERPLAPVSLPRFDPAVTAVAGTPGLAPLITALARAGAAFGDAPIPAEPLEAALEALRIRFHLVDTRWLDPTRPLWLAVPDPKVWPDGFFVVLPLRGGEAALRTGFGETLSPAPDHLGRVTLGANPAFVDLLGEHVVFTSHGDLFAKLSGYARDTLLAWTPPDALDVEVSVSNLRRIFAEELGAARDFAGGLGAQLTQRANLPVQAATVKAMIDGAFGFVDGADRLGVALDPSGARVRVAFGLRGVDGSELATTLAGLDGRASGLLAGVPASSWFGAAFNTPPELGAWDRATIVGTLTDGAGFTRANAEHIADSSLALNAVLTGDSAWSFATDGAFPLALTWVAGVTDRDKARAAFLGALGALLDHGLIQARAKLAEGGAIAPPLATLADVVSLLNTVGEPVGARVEVREEAPAGARVAGLVAHVDWDRLGLARTDPAVFEAIKAIVGPQVGFALADGDGRLVVAMGPNAFEQAGALAAGRFPGGEPNLDRAGRGAFAALSLRPGAMLQALSALPSLKDKVGELAKLPADQAVTLRGTAVGGTLVLTVDVALPLLVALFR